MERNIKKDTNIYRKGYSIGISATVSLLALSLILPHISHSLLPSM